MTKLRTGILTGIGTVNRNRVRDREKFHDNNRNRDIYRNTDNRKNCDNNSNKDSKSGCSIKLIEFTSFNFNKKG